MEIKSIEVYSEASNHAILRAPSRRFPGCLIQGDSLSSLLDDLEDVCKRLVELHIDDEELLHGCHDIRRRLFNLLDHYREVMAAHGIPGASKLLRAEDLVKLVEEE